MTPLMSVSQRITAAIKRATEAMYNIVFYIDNFLSLYKRNSHTKQTQHSNTIAQLFYHHRCPAVLVLLHAVLYGTEMIIEFRRPRPRLAVLTERIAHTRVEVVDI